MTDGEKRRAPEDLEAGEQSITRETGAWNKLKLNQPSLLCGTVEEEIEVVDEDTGGKTGATTTVQSEPSIQLKKKYVDQPEDRQSESKDQWENPDFECETGWILDLEEVQKGEKKRKQVDPDWEPYIPKNKSLKESRGYDGNKRKSQEDRPKNKIAKPKKNIGEGRKG